MKAAGRIPEDDDGLAFAQMTIMNPGFNHPGLSTAALKNWRHHFIRRFYLRPRITGCYLKRGLGSPALLRALLQGLRLSLRQALQRGRALEN